MICIETGLVHTWMGGVRNSKHWPNLLPPLVDAEPAQQVCAFFFWALLSPSFLAGRSLHKLGLLLVSAIGNDSRRKHALIRATQKGFLVGVLWFLHFSLLFVYLFHLVHIARNDTSNVHTQKKVYSELRFWKPFLRWRIKLPYHRIVSMLCSQMQSTFEEEKNAANCCQVCDVAVKYGMVSESVLLTCCCF